MPTTKKWPIDKRGNLSLKHGWVWIDPKAPAFDTASAKCVVYAFKLPVVEPLNATWRQVDDLLGKAFEQNDRFHNWAMQTLFKSEPVRARKDQKYPKQNKKTYNSTQRDLYNQARKLFPALSSSTISTTLNKRIMPSFNRSKFRVWNETDSIPLYKTNQPLHIPVVSYDLRQLNMCGSETWVIDLIAKAGKGGNRLQFRLAGGDKFGREHGSLEQVMKGNAKLGELCLVKEVCGDIHRHTTVHRNGGGQKQKDVLTAKLVVKAPMPVLSSDHKKVMMLSTHEEAFLSMWVGGKKFQVYNADHLKRWQAEAEVKGLQVLDPKLLEEHYGKLGAEKQRELYAVLRPEYAIYLSEKRRSHLQRFSDDRKAEHRGGHAPCFNGKSSDIARKFEQRTDSWIKQVCAVITNHARRRRIGEVVWNDTEGKILDGAFPWFKFESCLKNALLRVGITLVDYENEERAAAKGKKQSTPLGGKEVSGKAVFDGSSVEVGSSP